MLVHVNWTRYDRYIVVTRRRGFRLWQVVSTCRSERRARAVVAKLINTKGPWRYARILGSQPYYDPHVLLEVRQS